MVQKNSYNKGSIREVWSSSGGIVGYNCGEIVNCYNSDKYLEIALNSAISQTYKNWEMIIIDNKSNQYKKEVRF